MHKKGKKGESRCPREKKGAANSIVDRVSFRDVCACESLHYEKLNFLGRNVLKAEARLDSVKLQQSKGKSCKNSFWYDCPFQRPISLLNDNTE